MRQIDCDVKIRKEEDLISFVNSNNITHIVSFHSGIIFNTSKYSKATKIVNVYCASLPEYPGLAAINRALKDGRLNQSATIHRVTDHIDNGEIIRVRI